jgi:hypothetical protein
MSRKGRLSGHKSSPRKSVDHKSSQHPSSEPERLGMLVKRAEQAMGEKRRLEICRVDPFAIRRTVRT